MNIENFKKMVRERINIAESMREVSQPEPQQHKEPVLISEPQVEPVPQVEVKPRQRRPSKKFRREQRRRNSRTKPISVRLLKANFAFLYGKCRSEVINNLLTEERLKKFTKEKEVEHWGRVLRGEEEMYG